jgi:hypothetical protein
MDLAVQLHAAGRCDDAIREANDTWKQWTTRHHPTATVSRALALDLTAMLLPCDRDRPSATDQPENPPGDHPPAAPDLAKPDWNRRVLHRRGMVTPDLRIRHRR